MLKLKTMADYYAAGVTFDGVTFKLREVDDDLAQRYEDEWSKAREAVGDTPQRRAEASEAAALADRWSKGENSPDEDPAAFVAAVKLLSERVAPVQLVQAKNLSLDVCREVIMAGLVGWDLKDGETEVPCSGENKAALPDNVTRSLARHIALLSLATDDRLF